MIQIISYVENKKYEDKYILPSSLATPKSLDEFDINIIDLRDKEIWCNRGDTNNSINTIKDIKNLNVMIKKSKKTKIIVIIPSNQHFKYCYAFSSDLRKETYIKTIELKNMLDIIQEILFSTLLGIGREMLVFESTTTIFNEYKILSSFYFEYLSNEFRILTHSYKSEKATTIETEEFILTSLDLPYNPKAIYDYLRFLGFLEDKQTVPEWFIDIQKFDDEALMFELVDSNKQIEALKKGLKIQRKN